MFNLDLPFDELLEDIFSDNNELNETTVKLFFEQILKD